MGQTDSIKIVVADDHPLVLDGVRTVLERLDPSAVILEAHDYPGLLKLIADNPNLSLIVMDLAMPGRNGTDGLKDVQRTAPATPIAVLSGTEDRQTIKNTIESGIAGYIFKSSGSAELLTALNLILDGETYLPDGLTLAALEDVPSDAPGLDATAGFAALNHLPVGVLVVDGDAKVVFKNRCANEIISQSDGIEVGPTQICRASVVDETKQFHALIDDVIGAGDGGAISLSRPSMRRALSVVVAPLGEESDGSREKGLVAVFVSDPERQPAPQKETLMRLYELTDAEARVVQALVSGKRLETVAEEFNVSMNTVRSHLKQAFRKTETNRQSELVKLVLTGSAALAVTL